MKDVFLDYTRLLRAYDVRFLQAVPFELNTDERWFDVEMLLQAIASEAPIFELPAESLSEQKPGAIPWRYGMRIIRACAKYQCQKIGFFCSMQYRGLLRHDAKYVDKSEIAGSTHQRVVKLLKVPAKILDLGCGPGFVSRNLKGRGCYVVGIDAVTPAEYYGDQFIQRDIEKENLGEDLAAYDYVLILDVLEHLSDPERFLIGCRYQIQRDQRPTFVFSTGNVAFIGVRLALGMGLFNYGERGILDVSHKRLFTLSTFRRMLRETGYETIKVHGIGVPFGLLLSNRLGVWLSKASDLFARAWPSLMAYQILVEARPKPHSLMLLGSSTLH